MNQCAACAMGWPERCTGFYGVDDGSGMRVRQCEGEGSPEGRYRWVLDQVRVRLQLHLEDFPSQLVAGTLELVNDALEGKSLDRHQ